MEEMSYFESYKNSHERFNLFNNEVINMPRDRFTNTGIYKLKVLASYLLLIEETNELLTYKEIMLRIKRSLDKGNRPIIVDKELEKDYFMFHEQHIKEHQKDKGRRFRHLMGLCKIFKLLDSEPGKKSVIKFNKCREFAWVEDKSFDYSIRNSLLEIDIKNNPYIKNLKQVSKYIDEDSDYPIALTILKYIESINRPVTEFELSILLGRVDSEDTQDGILKRALDIGNKFPQTSEEQQLAFFNYMGWTNEDSSLFLYKESQQPWFKFKNFIILMQKFGLIKISEESELITLTDYSKTILQDELPAYILDFEKLIDRFDERKVKDSEIVNAIIQARYEGLQKILERDTKLIELINKRSLRDSQKDQHGKRRRNSLVMLFSKLAKNYKCDVLYYIKEDGSPQFSFSQTLFKNSENIGYCEGHHIIEFSRENGPDIVENILLLDPNTHMLIHHGHPQLKRELYSILRHKEIISLNIFKTMIDKYNCLTKEHVEILHNKGIIYFYEKPILIEKIQEKTAN